MLIRKSLIAIILILVLLPFASAGNKIIYDGFVNVDETAQTDIGEFSVRYYEKSGKQDVMVLEKTDESGFRLLIDDGECEYDQQYKFCFQGSQIGKHDYEKDIDIMAVKLHIEELVPSLERTIAKNELVPGEETKGTVRITIPEGRRASVRYTESFPPEIRVSTGKGVVRGNAVIYEGKIDGEFVLTYTLKLMAQKMEPYTAQGVMAYDLEGKEGKLRTEEAALSKLNDLEIEMEFDPEEAEIGEEAELEIDLDKKVDNALEIRQLDIIFPPGTQYIQTDSDFEQSGHTHSLTLARLTEDKEYTYRILKDSAGNYTVKIIAKTERDGEEQYQEKEAVLKSAVDDLKLGLVFPSIISYPENINLQAYFENKNEKTKFRDITCSITGDLFNEEAYTFSHALPGIRTNIADEKLDLEDTSQRNITHTFSCSYNLPSGETRSVEIVKESLIYITEDEGSGEEEEIEVPEEGIDRKVGFKDTDEEDRDTEAGQDKEPGEQTEEGPEEKQGFFKKLINWFKSLFSGDAEDIDAEEESEGDK